MNGTLRDRMRRGTTCIDFGEVLRTSNVRGDDITYLSLELIATV